MVEGLSDDPDRWPLDDRERALVDWALKVTRTPWGMTRDDLRPLRANGLEDRAILDLAMIVAYYAYVNRIASALGVELEPGGPPHAGHRQSGLE